MCSSVSLHLHRISSTLCEMQALFFNTLYIFVVIQSAIFRILKYFSTQQEFVMDLWDWGGKLIFVSMPMPVKHYLYSLNASADNLSVVVFGAEWTCMLAFPQKVESTAIARPL